MDKGASSSYVLGTIFCIMAMMMISACTIQLPKIKAPTSYSTGESKYLQLGYGQEIGDLGGVYTSFTSSDFPLLLADGAIVKDESTFLYMQSLSFFGTAADNEGVFKGTGQFVFMNDDDGDKLAKDYILFDDDSTDKAYKYEFRITPTHISYSSPSDLNGLTFSMLGREYTIIGFGFETSAPETSALVMNLTDGDTIYRLEDGYEAYKNGIKISGSNCLIKTQGGDSWYGLIITYTPQDEEYLSEGKSFSDPIFGNFRIEFKNTSRYVAEEAIAINSYVSEHTADILFFNGDDGSQEQKINFGWDGTKITSDYQGPIYTRYGILVGVDMASGGNPTIYLREPNTYNNGIQINVTLIHDGDVDKINVTEPKIMELVGGSGPQWNKTHIRPSITEGDWYYMTEWGNFLLWRVEPYVNFISISNSQNPVKATVRIVS